MKKRVLWELGEAKFMRVGKLKAWTLYLSLFMKRKPKGCGGSWTGKWHYVPVALYSEVEDY